MMVTPERWQQIKEVFQSAIDLPVVDRFAFLDRACAGDDGLRREVESLLSADEEPGSFINSPPGEVAAAIVAGERAALIGKTISHYKILGLLGVGGMGEVYLAHDTRLGRRVALKLLPESFNKDDERVRRFQREARSASALNHPNVCVIHEFGQTDDGRRFIAMEHIDGMTLRRRLQSGRLTVAESIEIAFQTGAALNVAHKAGVVHRDIKPENVMLRQDGFVKVLDFGLAKLTERYSASADSEARTMPVFNTGSGLLIGTAAYLSPEQACREKVDERSDIWSLGVVLYEMLTGVLPFTGKTPSHVIVSILEHEPTPVSQCAEAVPVGLDEIVQKALRKDPLQRYQTTQEFTEDLDRLKREVTSGVVTFRKFPWRGRITSRSLLALTAGLLLIASGLYFLVGRRSTTASAPAINSIAVLPFTNESNDPNIEYLSDGMTESLMNGLSKLPNLKVTGRSSAFRYKGRQANAHTVGQDLGVQAVLTGRILEHDGELRISVDLEDARDGSHIWGEQYDRKVSDLLTIQNEISHVVTEKLRLRLSGDDEQRLAKNYTDNVDAYQAYLKGRWFWSKRTVDGQKQAAFYFQQALKLDPNYALAYAGLADVYVIDGSVPLRDSYLRAKEATARALALDNKLGEAHATLGFIKAHYERDWSNSEAEFKQAIQLSPNHATAHQWYADELLARGRFDEAMLEFKRAAEIDPLSPVISTDIGLVYFYRGDYDRSIEHLKKMVKLFPDFYFAHLYLGWAYTQKQMYAEAMAEYQQADRMSKGYSLVLAMIGYTNALSGHRAEALKAIKELEVKRSKGGNVPPLRFALVYTALGDKEKALEWLNRGYDEFDLHIIYIQINPFFETLRKEPKFADLIRRLNLASS